MFAGVTSMMSSVDFIWTVYGSSMVKGTLRIVAGLPGCSRLVGEMWMLDPISNSTLTSTRIERY